MILTPFVDVIALSKLMCKEQHSSFIKVLDSIRSVSVGVVCLEYEGADVLPEKHRVVCIIHIMLMWQLHFSDTR